MPRRTKRRSGRRRGGRKSVSQMMGQTCRIPFNFILSHIYSGGTSVNTNLVPGIDSLVGGIAANFEFYRFTKLMIKGLPAGTLYDFTYIPSNEANYPVDSYASVALSALNKCLSQQMSVPQTINVPRNLLFQTPEDWWSTNSASSSNIYRQGRIVSATPVEVGTTITFTISGIVEFKCPTVQVNDLKCSSSCSVTNPSQTPPSCGCSRK